MKTNNTKPPPALDPDTIFAELLQDLPPETAALARAFKAFARARKLQTPEQLLRVVLLFAALDYSEREIAANLLLVAPALGPLSNQAIRGRLAACLPWLQALLPRLVAAPDVPSLPPQWRLLALDASEITAPGGRSAWRLHAVLDVQALQLVALQLTDRHTGETLCNFQWAAGDVVLTDRGYSHRRGVAHVRAQGGHVVTRYNPHHIPLLDAAGQAVDLQAWLHDCAAGETRTCAGWFTAPDGTRHGVWVHAVRLGAQAAAAARRRCRRAGARGKYTPTAKTLFLAEFVLVLSTVPPLELSAAVVLAVYRCRWQIELLFKRYKSLLDLDHLRARAESVLGAVWLHGKLLYAALLEQRARRHVGADGLRLEATRHATWWRVWRLVRDELLPLITLVACWQPGAWHTALKALRERPRRRRLQQLPAAFVVWLQRPVPSTESVLGGPQ